MHMDYTIIRWLIHSCVCNNKLNHMCLNKLFCPGVVDVIAVCPEELFSMFGFDVVIIEK